IGRAFGTIVARNDGKRVAVGYDGRLTSPELEKSLVAGLKASGMHVLRIGCGPTPMLYYTATVKETDGAVMVTGSHNPPDYNGFKMMIGRKPFFGEQILRIGKLAESVEVVEQADGSVETVDIMADYAGRLLADWDGGDRMLKVVWDNGNGGAGSVLAPNTATLSRARFVLNPASAGPLPVENTDP